MNNINSNTSKEIFHVAFLLRDLGQGGAERSSLRLANGLANFGMKVTIFILKRKGEMLDSINPDIQVIDIKSSFFRLLSSIRSMDIDFLLPIYTSMRALLAKAILKMPFKVVLSQRNMFTLDRGPIQTRLRFLRCKLLYRYTDACVCISEGVAEEMRTLNLLPVNKIHVIYNPVVNKELLSQIDEPIDDPWFGENSDPVIIGVGRLGDQKDFATLIKAFEIVSKRRRNLKLLLLGEGKQRKMLENMVVDLELSERVRMPGYTANPYPYMKRAALFVLTSRYEGFGNVVPEALACGCNVVSTDCKSGPSEVLEGGKYGALAQVGNPEDIAGAINTMLDNPLPKELLISRAKFFREERAVEDYFSLFKKLRVQIPS
ncbi:MAG: glycosyltransferase [Synergistaceae bacterium]|nr:glycosyltransferase [Synergistaceae bacterium]